MSEVTSRDDGYAPVGKYTFAIRVFGLIALGALILAGLHFALGDKRGDHAGRAMMSLLWIGNSIWSILRPARARGDTWPPPSLHSIRVWSIVTLILFTIIATLETRSLFSPE